MTWEETIIEIRKNSAFSELVEKAYLDEDVLLNIERFRKSEEFNETLKQIRKIIPDFSNKKVLDLGAGNGIATLAFALEGMNVCAVEPYPSETVGYKAIQKAEDYYKTGRIHISCNYGESLPHDTETFDIVYVRQAMHHAFDLKEFVKEAARVLKKKGLLVTVRDHVIYNEADKKWFLDSHPLHRFYGGENAFTYKQYHDAITGAGLVVKLFYRHYDNIINYFPEPREVIDKRIAERDQLALSIIKNKLPSFFSNFSLLKKILKKRLEKKIGPANDERKIPGRHISFFAIKD